MLGRNEEAEEKFIQAEEFFKETGDPRGKVYCVLGRGELSYIRGDRARALRAFRRGEKIAADYGFLIEKKYAHRLLTQYKSGRGFPLNLP
jgi:tetratricopeptide (TPR) repeat protein